MSSFIRKWTKALPLFALVVAFQFLSGNLVSQTAHIPSPRAVELGYLSQYSISITKNQDFIAQGWPGNGTMDEPYVLENLNMVCDYQTGIFIANTTAFFEVRNCRFTAADSGVALLLNNVTHGVARSCESSGCDWHMSNSSLCSIESTNLSGHKGLGFWGCTNCSAVGNCFSLDASSGVYFTACTDCSFVGNVVRGSAGVGFELVWCVNCSVRENELAQNFNGIQLLGSNDTLVSHNSIHDNWHYGLEIYSCGSTRLIENLFMNDGVVMHYWGWGWITRMISGQDFVGFEHLFQDNAVNGKPLGFFQNFHGCVIDGSPYGQVILVNCSDLTVDHGVTANTSIGVQVLFSDNCTLTHMALANCSDYGAIVEQSNCTRVLECAATDNLGAGLFLGDSFNVVVANSSMSGNSVGLGLSYLGYCTILNNTLSLNTYGTGFYHASDCLFVNNTVLHNKFGVYLDDDCHHNVFYGNSIGWNEQYNAESGSFDNQWDDGISRGNKWSDYSGFGVYEINHWEVDHFPELLGSLFSLVQLALIGIGMFAGVIIVAVLVLLRRSHRMSQEV